MRLKLFVHQFINKNDKNSEKVVKILFPVEDFNSTNQVSKDHKVFKVEDILSKICLQFDIAQEKVKIQAEFDGFILFHDSPVHLLFKDDDEIRITIKPRSNKDKATKSQTESLITKSIDFDEKKVTPTEKKRPLADPVNLVNRSVEQSQRVKPKKKQTKKHKANPEDESSTAKKILPILLDTSPKPQTEPAKPLLTISRFDISNCIEDASATSNEKAKPTEKILKKQLKPADSVYNPLDLPVVDLDSNPPEKDQMLIFKISELGPDYMPIISEFKEALVLNFEPATETITYKLLTTSSPSEPNYDEEGNPILGKFDFPDTSIMTESDGVVTEYLVNTHPSVFTVPFSYLVDPRHLLLN